MPAKPRKPLFLGNWIAGFRGKVEGKWMEINSNWFSRWGEDKVYTKFMTGNIPCHIFIEMFMTLLI